MIFEMRTYLLKPGTVPQAEAAFTATLPARIKLSRLAGFWRTEVGPHERERAVPASFSPLH